MRKNKIITKWIVSAVERNGGINVPTWPWPSDGLLPWPKPSEGYVIPVMVPTWPRPSEGLLP